jgi:hypothetical protein
MTHPILADGSRWQYGYNDRDEVISGNRSWVDWAPARDNRGQISGFDIWPDGTMCPQAGEAGTNASSPEHRKPNAQVGG